ncbi:MAG: hypothetical protein R6W67_06800 [Bacteroidales bacterium]
MKRKVAYSILFLLIAVSVNSCELLLQNCKTCKQVMYNNDGTVFQEYPEAVYCDEQLTEILAKQPITSGSTTTKWECR